MSWEPLGASRASDDAGVTLSCSAGSAKLPALLTITIRTDRLPDDQFLRAGSTCQVLFGRGPDAGKLRVVPGGPSTVFAMGRSTHRSKSCTIRVKAPSGMSAGRHGPDPVEYQIGADSLDLTLPAWAIAVEQVTAPVATGRTSIMDRVTDPAAALRGRGGR